MPIVVAVFDGEIKHLPAWESVVRSHTTSTDVVCFRSHRASVVEAMPPSEEAAENAMVSLVGLVVVVVVCAAIVWVVLLFVRARRKRFYFVLLFSYRTVRSIIN